MAMVMVRVLGVMPWWMVPLVMLTVRVLRVLYAVRGDGAAGNPAGDCMRRNGCCCTYDFSSCFPPKFKIMHFQNRSVKLYTVVLLVLCFLKIVTKLCCR